MPGLLIPVIGAVVLGLVAAAVLAFLWLSSAGRDSDFRFYTVYFEHQSLDGLQVGAAVNMRGIAVGRVARIQSQPIRVGVFQTMLKCRARGPGFGARAGRNSRGQ